MARPDPHSYTEALQAQISHLDWKADLDFERRVLRGEARLSFRSPASAGPLDLDTRDLAIESVKDADGRALEFALGTPDPILGTRLTVQLPDRARQIVVRYQTSPEATALQWLTPAQTAGGKAPFLFSQCQAIHARSVVPLQDTPALRITYRAEISAPRELEVVMAAASLGRTDDSRRGRFVFEMRQPIPPYLLALAAGRLAFKDLSGRCRVWAEPETLDRAAYEFAHVENMLAAAEKLFGPYDWERFDLLTMPPSFPYGGMENPRLTFLTPTLITGDRSLVNVVAHELAHSWTGNLITNANAEHFWLNEGLTVFAERRILEALEGADMAALHAAIGRRELDRAFKRFSDRPQLTHLVPQLEGVDPDEAFSVIPYEKGYLFLRAIEEHVGRGAFDGFLRRYIERFRFRSVTTRDFLELLDETLPGTRQAVRADEWLYQPNVPSNAPLPRSRRLESIAQIGATVPEVSAARAWAPAEWQVYLESLPHPSPLELCRELDERFQLTRSVNHDVLVSWLVLATESSYEPALPRVEALLREVGRMKYLRPLYTALLKRPQTEPLARRCFELAKDMYHPIAQHVVRGLLSAQRKA